MKHFTKIALLVALVLLFTMAACTRQASTGPASAPTTEGEAPFPYTTPSNNLEALGTLTAIAETPQADATETPQVFVETPAEQQPATDTDAEAGGGQDAPVAPAPAPAADIPPITRPESYTLQRGEWPICIARRFDLDLGTFFQANGLSMQSKPAAGTVLRIPASGSWSPSYGARALRAHPTTHQVGANDSIYSIACAYGDVSPEQILAANSLSSPSDIRAGMTINIP
jgi:LysM repeat protein